MNEEAILLAGCVILDDYGRILLLHRDLGEASRWELPGGKVEEEELPEAAAVRELQEELGVSVRLTKALGSEDFEDGEQLYKFYWFQAEIERGELQIMETETFDDYDYIDLEDLPSIALSANMIVFEAKLVHGDVVLDG